MLYCSGVFHRFQDAHNTRLLTSLKTGCVLQSMKLRDNEMFGVTFLCRYENSVFVLTIRASLQIQPEFPKYEI